MIRETDDIYDVAAAALDPEQIFTSMHRAVCRFDVVIGRPMRTPDDLDDQEIAAYEAAWRKVMSHIDEHEKDTLMLNDVAALANRTLQEFVQQDPILPFDQIDERLRQKWRFLVRHLYNLLAYDKNEDDAIQRHEEQIEAQFRDTLEKMSLITRSNDVQ